MNSIHALPKKGAIVAAVTITKENFNETIENNDVVILDFWAEWCGPCKAFAPTFEKMSEEYPNVVFGKIDTEAEQEIAQAFRIRSIPTLMIFREQIMLFNEAGSLPESQLKEILGKALELDMEDVRADVAKQQAEEAAQQEAK